MTTTSTSANAISPNVALSTAAARLRCHHAHPVLPPAGSLANPGPCTHCGVPHAASSPVADRMREPLAAWLDTFATWWDNAVVWDGAEILRHATADCGDEAPDCGCFDAALAVARVVNGDGA